MNKGEVAKQYFLDGMNCAQAVVLAFKDEMGLPEDELKRLAIGYGGGFGRLRLVCGAVCGMTMVLGKLLSDGVDRATIYPYIQEACSRFKIQAGSLVCADMLEGVVVNDGSPVPEQRTESYYKKRPCAEIVSIAANIAGSLIVEVKGE